jgi:serine/threonine-protein kinase
VDPGTRVDVVISTGPASLIVPDLGGRSLDEALAAVKNVDLSPHIVYLVQPDTPPGTVIDQAPPASSAARRGQMMNLTIAVPGIVPNVAGMSLDQAQRALAACGYAVGNVAYTQEGMDGKVIRTEPEAGAPLRPGEAVTIYYNNAYESR